MFQTVKSTPASLLPLCYVALFYVALASPGVPAAEPVSMTLLAPGMVTDLTRVEARVSIRNPTDAPQTYALQLDLDSSVGTHSLATTEITVPPQGQELFTSWFSTQGLGGSNQVRFRATPNGGAPLVGASPLQVVASDSRAAPLITAAWIDPGAVLPGLYPQRRRVTAQDVRDSVDAAYAVGVDTLIITYSEYLLNGWGAFYPSPSMGSGLVGFDVVGTVLNQASQNGQRVFVGLGRGNDLLLTWDGFHDPVRNASALAHGTTMANELWNLYGDEPSFFGWYLTHEANDIGSASNSFYNPMVAELRQFEADKPVMISPAGTPIISPQILAHSAVDVFAYQDAVGSGYIPYVNTFDPQRRIATLDAVYAAYQAAHANVDKHLWTNLENWQMDGPAYGNAYPADFSRLAQQLAVEKSFVDVVSSYEWLGMMESPDSTVRLGGERAVDLYVDYRDYYQQTAPTLKRVNFVSNGGFEEGLGAFSEAPAKWQFSGNGSDQTFRFSDETPTATENSLQLEVDVPDALAWLYQDVPVVPGAQYKFSAWAKRLAQFPHDGWLAAQVWMLSDSASGVILDSTALQFEDAIWDFQSSWISAPQNAGVARIVMAVQNSAFAAGIGRYLIDSVSLVGPSVVANADFDADGDVDARDLQIWQSQYGSPAHVLPLPGDADANGVAEGEDFLAWQSQFGLPTATAASPTPEPTSLVALGLLAAISLFQRARRDPLGVVLGASALLMSWTTQPLASAHPLAKMPEKSATAFSTSMSVVPPVVVTKNVDVEIRIAIRNQSTKAARFEVVLSIEPVGGKRTPLFGTPMEVAAGGQELLTHWLATRDYAGVHSLHCRVSGENDFVEESDWPLVVVDCPSRAAPLLQIGWIDPGAFIPGAYPQRRAPTDQDLRAAIDAYHDLGISALIVTYAESVYLANGVFYPSQVFREEGANVSFDVVGTILDQASKNGQHVFLGLGRGPDLLLTWTGFDDPRRNEVALARSMKTATELWALYRHEPSFYGWYLSHEANDIARASKSYYNPISRFLRTFEADKPVLVSPSGTPIVSTAALRESEVDIFAYQDAVGSGYVPYENTFDPNRRIDSLSEVFASYAQAHRDSRKHLWANLEIWQMDGPEYGKSYPPEFERVRRQLEIEQNYVDVVTTYTLSGFMEPPDSPVELGGPKAVRLFEAYRDYVQRLPTAQRGLTTPSASRE